MGCTQPTPDRASHPNFQSIPYAEHEDQITAHAAKHRKTAKKQTNERTIQNTRMVSAREKKEEKQKIGKGGFVRGGLGDVDQSEKRRARYLHQKKQQDKEDRGESCGFDASRRGGGPSADPLMDASSRGQ